MKKLFSIDSTAASYILESQLKGFKNELKDGYNSIALLYYYPYKIKIYFLPKTDLASDIYIFWASFADPGPD
jgi:hypothetical protein